jgi:hypothetical protein
MTLTKLLLTLACSLVPAAAAMADEAPKKGHHTLTLMLGPEIGISDSYKDAQFDLLQAYTYHLSGDPSGLYFGLELQEGMGKFLRFGAGARAGYDFQIPGMPLYVSPVVRIGVSLVDLITSEAYFNLVFGAEAKYVLPIGVSLFLRPVGINLSMGTITVASYDLLAGAGYTF